MKPIVFHPLAASELDEAVEHYEGIRGGLGLALHKEVVDTTEIISGFPNIGSVDPESGYRHLVVNRFPYVLFYLEEDDAIWIVAVAHGKRRPGYWQGRKV